MAGGFRIKLSVSFVFKLERLSSDFVVTSSKLLNINYFHTCEVLFLKGRKLRSRECAFRDNNTHSVSGSITYKQVEFFIMPDHVFDVIIGDDLLERHNSVTF